MQQLLLLPLYVSVFAVVALEGISEFNYKTVQDTRVYNRIPLDDGLRRLKHVCSSNIIVVLDGIIVNLITRNGVQDTRGTVIRLSLMKTTGENFCLGWVGLLMS
jgi:hypothetical protein